jgi:hypothetical protein
MPCFGSGVTCLAFISTGYFSVRLHFLFNLTFTSAEELREMFNISAELIAEEEAQVAEQQAGLVAQPAEEGN